MVKGSIACNQFIVASLTNPPMGQPLTAVSDPSANQRVVALTLEAKTGAAPGRVMAFAMFGLPAIAGLVKVRHARICHKRAQKSHYSRMYKVMFTFGHCSYSTHGCYSRNDLTIMKLVTVDLVTVTMDLAALDLVTADLVMTVMVNLVTADSVAMDLITVQSGRSAVEEVTQHEL